MTTSGATPTSCFAWRSCCSPARIFGGIVTGVIGVLFPPRCALCGRDLDGLSVLCPMCESELPELEGPRCRRCGEPVDAEGLDLCIACGTKDQPLDGAVFLGPYDGSWGALVRMLKFNREPAIARDLGRRLASALEAACIELAPDWVTYVPMSRVDRRARGFNQARLLARVIARQIGVPLRRSLVKTRRTVPQGRLSAADRRRNLRGAFRPVPCFGGNVVLVDDICTTGSTIEECARALKRGGAQTVTVLAVARA